MIALAAALRFGWAGVNSFAGDEARISLDALRMHDEFVMAGQQSSVNIPFLPLSVWVYALPYRLSNDPLFATQFTAALNVLAVIGVWALGRKWHPGAGWIAALFLAASPYGVFYARSIWQPNLLAPLATLWLGLAYLAVTQSGRPRSAAIAACVAVGLSVVQVHFAGVAFVLGTAYLFFRVRWYKSLLPVIIGAAVALIFALPYLYYITVIDPNVLARFGSVAGGEVAYSLDGFANLTRLALNWDWGYLGQGDYDTYGRDPFAPLLVGLLLLNGLIGLVRELMARVHGGRDESRPDEEKPVGERSEDPTPPPAPPRIQGGETEKSGFSPLPACVGEGLGVRGRGALLAEFVLLLLLISPLAFLRHSSPVLIHYQLIALPATALLVGVGMIRARAETQLLTAAVAVTVAVVWTLQAVNTLNYAALNRPPNSALSSILRESRDVAYGSEAPVLMFTHGDVAAIDGEVAVFETLLWDQPHRVINGDVLLILPPEPTTLIATLAPFQMWEELVAAGLAVDVREFPRREGALPFMTTRYDGVSDPQGFTALDPVAFADGTTLEGWRVRWVGSRFRVSTLWRVGDLTTTSVVQQFHHLRNADTREGEPFMGSDVPLSIHTWRSGDQVIVMADFFDVPPGEGYTLDIGHYTLPDLQRITRADGETFVRVDVTVPPP